MKKSEYIIIGILILGGFGILGYVVGERVKTELELGIERPLVQIPHVDVVAGRDDIKISG
ncbi:MAG: hypothetical protein QXW37_00640 [Candidatus Nitrosotenuis sp.]